jgi:predicted kinase
MAKTCSEEIRVTHIFLLAGAPAVGKSTTAHALAAQFQKSVHIPVDDMRSMVVSGLIQPGADWGQGLIEQLALARENAAHMAIAYHQAGFVVVIDDFWDPNSQLLEYHTLFQNPTVHKILLYPSQQVAEERNQQRAGPGDGSAYIADGIRAVYAHLNAAVSNLERQGWLVVDTTDKSIEATVRHILTRIG